MRKSVCDVRRGRWVLLERILKLESVDLMVLGTDVVVVSRVAAA
jgi:hypothetical protein